MDDDAPAEGSRAKHAAWLGPACAVAATGLGLVYLAVAGAPGRYAAVNAAALVVGLIAMALVAKRARPWGFAVLALGTALLATALFGHALDGVTRWVRVDPLSLQPSLILLPAMCVMFAGVGGGVAAGGMSLAALALALQPDRAMAGALVAALTAVTFARPDRWRLTAWAVAVAGFVVTLARPDTLPAQAYVERVLNSAFQVHVFAGLAVWIGAAVLILPAVAGAILQPDDRARYLAFGAVWLAIIAAAVLGNYPTPLVGYGASSILGYALSVGALNLRSAVPVPPRTARATCV